MSSLVPVIRGANVLLTRPLFQADGVTPLPCGSLVVCQVDLYLAGKKVKTLVRGTDPELRNGSDAKSLNLELTSAITSVLKQKGELTEVYTLGVAAAEYVAEPGKALPKIAITQVVIA
jgi:hypothetical protein